MHPMLQSFILSIRKIQKVLMIVGRVFFSSLNEDELSVISDFGGPEWKKRDTNVIDDISFDKVVRSSSSVDFASFKT